MSKTEKELAFLHDLYIAKDWTERFTGPIAKNLALPKKGRVLYVNSGTANHLMELREKLHRDVELIAVSENEHLEKIAQAKIDAMRVKIRFERLDELESESFDLILADLTFAKGKEFIAFLDEITFLTKKKGQVAFFLPTAGSFGEIFSLLWETFLGMDLIEKSGEIERIVAELPTISGIEEAGEFAGLANIQNHTAIEIFDYVNAAEFIESSLATDSLFPGWLDFMTEKERKKALKKLADVIDLDRGELTFRFSLKATFFTAEKL